MVSAGTAFAASSMTDASNSITTRSNVTRAAASAGFLKLAEVLAKQIRRRKPEVAKSDALFALSAMVGAVTLSRIVADPDLSAAILRDTKRRVASV